MKRIVIFADGTWNSPENGPSTNVLKLARAIKAESNGVKQVVFYDWGVGTDRKEFMGGISGKGINKNIKDCYRFLVHNYEEGDELFFFGFSRGAFTVRSLAGFIRNSGLLKKEYASRTDDAYKLYKTRGNSSHPNSNRAKEFRDKYSISDITKIKFIGVWDSVGSLGVPLPFWGTLGESDSLFHDVKLSKSIEYARHALSIDENRIDFEPTLWEENGVSDLKQVWFSGVHSDVGGGYKEKGLSDCSLLWMIEEAKKIGLTIENFIEDLIDADYTGVLHNERKGVFLIRGSLIRDIWDVKKNRLLGTSIHSSVKKRWENNTDNYQKKSKALKKLLKLIAYDWAKVNSN